MKRLCVILRSCGLILCGAGTGVFLTGRLVQSRHWGEFPVFFLGWGLLVLGGFLIGARTREEEAERKARAVERYGRMKTRFGDKTLRRIRHVGIAFMVAGLIAMLLVGLASGDGQWVHPASLGVIIAGLLLVLFMDPSGGEIGLNKSQRSQDATRPH
jgi:hypothetical protein